MNMTKKIALTASTMFFVLTQIFSFYVIFINHQEKIDLLKQEEKKIFTSNISSFGEDMRKANYEADMEDFVVVYHFRSHIPEDSAVYRENRELFNSSSFSFDVENLDLTDTKYILEGKEEKINGKNLLIFYQEYESEKYRENARSYIFFYVVDVTSIYENSWNLITREVFVSLLSSFGMAALLIVSIKKITKPLQDINEAQRQLIGSMSHELKTPLTVIKGYAETLLQVKLSREQEEKALDYINRESGRLSRLSEKMMELTRLYEPECEIKFQEISVETLFDSVEESVAYRLKEKNITLKREGNLKGLTKAVDSDLMTSFLINLINNSIMASESGACIYLGADEKSLWVRDEGAGIPEEEIEKIRKAFYRVDKSRSRKSGNMGLGLALCEQIAAVHQGKMEIESRLLEGTKISFVR